MKYTVLLALSFLPLSPLVAQQVAFRVDGEIGGDHFGGEIIDWGIEGVGFVGDTNGDGWDDMVAGSPNGGYAKILSGKDGATLHRFSAPAGDKFGCSVRGAGDVDGDGFPDIVVGARHASGTRGMAYVFSGSTGATLHTFTGYGSIDILGHSVAGVGDVDLDGYDDVVLGAPENPGRGYVQVRSGQSGAILYEWFGRSSDSQFGWAVAGPGDTNQDGYPDILISGNGNNSSPISYAELRSGKDGSVLYYLQEPKYWADIVDAAGDLDADGHADFFVGTNPTRFYSGKDGSVLHEFTVPYNRTAGAIGDIDGDGHDDFCMGDMTTGLVEVFSGSSGLAFAAIQLPAGEFRGGSLASGGDQDWDGVPDLLVGCPHASYSGADSGSAYVYLLPGPGLHLTVSPLVRGQPATLTAADAMAGSTTWFCYSTKGAGPWTHPAHGFTLLLSPPLGKAGTAYAFLSGPVSITVTVPNQPPAGLPVWIQAVEGLGNPPSSFRVSNQVATFLQ